MTTQINLEETYNELSNLLKDVCSFLNSEVRNGTLSTGATSQAETLLKRLKNQVEVVSKISALQESTNSNYPYLQMQGPTLVEDPLSEYVDADSTNHYEEEDYEESYAQIGNESLSLPPTSSMINEDLCPFEELPMSELSNKAIKCGPLIRKERYFIIEQKKQLFVGLVGYWLLIYCANKKDVKPLQILNLTEYRAQAKKDPIFEIVCENKKTHEFIAKSAKDMDQWIVAINCKKQTNLSPRNLPDIPGMESNSDEVDLDKVSNNNTSNKIMDDFDSEQDIYENVDDIRKKEPVSRSDSIEENEDITPKLPARQQITYVKKTRISTENSTYNNVTINVSQPMEDDDEEENTYDPVQNGDDEEEEIYDEPKLAETIKQINKSIFTPATNEYDNEDDEDCSYDIPRSDTFNQKSPSQIFSNQASSTNTYDEYEDEDVEYDELKIIPENNNSKQEIKEADHKLDVSSPEKNKTAAKPAIMSPKPKVQGRLEKLTAFTRRSENNDSSSQDGRKIHNIIQQMEASLTFKGKN